MDPFIYNEKSEWGRKCVKVVPSPNLSWQLMIAEQKPQIESSSQQNVLHVHQIVVIQAVFVAFYNSEWVRPPNVKILYTFLALENARCHNLVKRSFTLEHEILLNSLD